MTKEIHLRIDKELSDEIEKFKIENNLENKIDTIRILLNYSLKSKNSFIYRLKNLFKF